MNNDLKVKKVYEVMKVEDGLPEKDGLYLTKAEDREYDHTPYEMNTKEFGYVDHNGNFRPYELAVITHWLKPVEGILISREGLIELVKEAYRMGSQRLPFYSDDKFIEEKGLTP